MILPFLLGVKVSRLAFFDVWGTPGKSWSNRHFLHAGGVGCNRRCKYHVSQGEAARVVEVGCWPCWS